MLLKHRLRQTGTVQIALVHYSYQPVIGGVEMVMAAHARLFADAGHEVTIVCRRGVSADPRIRVELLPAADDALPFLTRLFARQEVVFLHNVCTMPFDLALTEAAWDLAESLPAVRFICWVHDLAACNPDYTDAANQASRWFRRAHAHYEYVTVSDQRAEQLEKVTGARARVIPNGVDPVTILGLSKNIAALTRQHELLIRDVVLLHPARLLRRKRVEVSLRVVAALKEAGHSSGLLVTGPVDAHNPESAAYVEELHALRDKLQIHGEAFFLQPDIVVDAPDLASLYHVADVLLFPSRDEGFGLPVLEAALHRMLVFCPDVPPFRTRARDGLHLFDPDIAPEDLAQIVAREVGLSPTAQARKGVTRDSAWEAIYQNFLAPLLREH